MRRLLLILLFAAAAFAQPNPLVGKWEGTLAARLRLVLRVDAGADGGLTAALDSLDQGNVTIQVDNIGLEAGTVRFALKTIGATFEGKLQEGGGEISGTFQQGGANLPLTLRKAGVAPKFKLQPATLGKIAFTPCFTRDGNGEALCGSYDVFENRQSRAGRKISLSIMVLPAIDPKPAADPVFFFAGGPGESAAQSGPLVSYGALLRRQRHIVLIDQRGTGKSNLLQCEVKNPKSLQSLVGDYFDLDRLRACRTELEKTSDLAQYTTTNFIEDVDEVRAAMGFPAIDVIGGSYGTETALVYLRSHPEHVRAVALNAVKPTTYKLPLTFAKTIQASMELLLAGDAKLSEEFHALLGRLEKEPAQFEVGGQKVTLSRGAFLSNLRILLYIPQLKPQLPKMLDAAFQGNWGSYTIAVASVTAQLEPAIARGMSFSVICAEDVPAITEEEIRRETGGTWIGDYQVRFMQLACKLWPRGAVPAGFFDPVRSDKPVLLIAGSDDPATPASAAREAARTLSNSRVLEIPGGTHLTQSACIDKAIAQFISTAQPGSVAACPAP
jgi:pimeloyl-ACP methyl ester carboxylesterase